MAPAVTCLSTLGTPRDTAGWLAAMLDLKGRGKTGDEDEKPASTEDFETLLSAGKWAVKKLDLRKHGFVTNRNTCAEDVAML